MCHATTKQDLHQWVDHLQKQMKVTSISQNTFIKPDSVPSHAFPSHSSTPSRKHTDSKSVLLMPDYYMLPLPSHHGTLHNTIKWGPSSLQGLQAMEPELSVTYLHLPSSLWLLSTTRILVRVPRPWKSFYLSINLSRHPQQRICAKEKYSCFGRRCADSKSSKFIAKVPKNSRHSF